MIEYINEQELDEQIEQLERKKRAIIDYRIKKCDEMKQSILSDKGFYSKLDECHISIQLMISALKAIKYPFDYGYLTEIYELERLESVLAKYIRSTRKIKND